MKCKPVNTRNPMPRFLLLGLCLIIPLSSLHAAVKKEKGPDPYYKEEPLFRPYPPSKGTFKVKNFGPVGIGINLVGNGATFKLVINNVEKGSPAEATGKLKVKQVIKSINGQIMKERDPREILGDLISEAEAKDGRIVLDIEGVGEVVVNIPVMGSYSKSWPLHCEKSDKVVRKLADFLGKQEKPGSGAALFLLSTGEEKDLAVVRKWMSELEPFGAHQWNIGYQGIGICEYYLRTGDEKVLPIIKGAADILRDTMYNGGWSGRGNPAQFSYSTGSGHMNAAGVHCMSFLMLARMCGVEVDDYMFRRSTRNFFRFAGHGNVAYGDGWPESGFRDNGKTGGLAVTMAIAARLTPEGENSVYAKARDISAMKGFYGTSWFHSAHTGGGIGEIWHHAAMSLMHEKRPAQHRSFLDTRRWVMELSRRHNGAIGIAGVDDRYDQSAGEDGYDWGTYFALTYTIPRKTLQLSGAPKTRWCKTATLPERPWGSAADDRFLSSEPAAHSSISKADLLNERVETDASVAVFAQLYTDNPSDETLLKYLHHPEYAFRMSAAGRVVRLGRNHLVLPLLKSSDPRLRQAGLTTLSGKAKEDRLAGATPEMYALAGRMLADPDESWWVKISAADAIENADPKLIAQYADPLMGMLESKYWWLSAAACKPLSVLAISPEHYKRVQPALIKTIANSEANAGVNTIYGYAKTMNGASPEVKAFAAGVLKDVYLKIPAQYKEPSNGIVINGRSSVVKRSVSYAMGSLPGSENFIKTLPKMNVEAKRSGRDEDMYIYSGTFTPNKALMGSWIELSKVAATKESVAAFLKDWKKQGSKPFWGGSSVLKLQDKGRVQGDGKYKHWARDLFWSGDMLISLNLSQEALRMKVVTVDGFDFLLIERGGFNKVAESADVGESDEAAESDERVENSESQEDLKNWHPGYKVHVRMDDRMKLVESKKK